MLDAKVVQEIEQGLEELGFELVEMEQAGHRARPIIRLRIDRPDSVPGAGVTVEDCRIASRALEQRLDELPQLAATYVLEVSSPGVERPLIRRRDFERFAGQEVALIGKSPLAGRAKRLEGELIGLRGKEPEERVAIRLAGDEEIEVPRGEITRAHLVFRWGGTPKPS